MVMEIMMEMMKAMATFHELLLMHELLLVELKQA